MPTELPGAGEAEADRGPLRLVELRSFRPLGADVVVTTRVGGVSRAPYDTLNLGDHVGDEPLDVAENRRRVAAALRVPPDALLIARQVHGAQVAHVGLGDVPGDADVLVTRDDRVAVAVLVADCVPLVIVDPQARVLVVAHAGWRGVTSGVVRAAVDAAIDVGADPARCRAAIGPSISGATYQVGPEVAVALEAAGLAHAVAPDGDGRFHADLAAACGSQLRGAGLVAQRVWATARSTDGGVALFSDRAHRPCGRFALAARLVAGAS